MNDTNFLDLNNWMGSFYELSIEFHPVGNNKRLNDALFALEKCNFFTGLWQIIEDNQVNKVSLPINIDEDGVREFYGILTLSDGNTLPCAITIIRTEEESDWLDIGIPLALVEKKYDCHYPLTTEYNPWLEIVNDLFIKLAEMMYHYSSFDLTLIGEEVSGHTNQETITVTCLEEITCILPYKLQNQLGVQHEGKQLTNQLMLFS